ncbi:hypothetical protein [Lelliottia amnigena]|uniref:hypothetical protein n=1 Tax=Lelliottia amnigena TaxID=61646 RepID=UPI000FB6662F|nr:hypothetical protein [Lelliottia amnigena]MCU7783095.1 hypothetical protein [Lelliottia amnigena]
MPNSTAIKWLHRMLTTVLLLMVVAFIAYQHYTQRMPDDDLYASQKVTDGVYLYVTKYKGGGATVSDVYRYYLDGKLDGDILSHLKERAAFLVADVGNAQATGYGTHININITGRVYSFTNADLFYCDGVAIMPIISMTANGVR